MKCYNELICNTLPQIQQESLLWINTHKDEMIPYDDLYDHFTSVIQQSDDKVVLKPHFNRKILALTKAQRDRSRINGLSKYVFKGITLRSLLKDNAQASLDLG